MKQQISKGIDKAEHEYLNIVPLTYRAGYATEAFTAILFIRNLNSSLT